MNIKTNAYTSESRIKEFIVSNYYYNENDVNVSKDEFENYTSFIITFSNCITRLDVIMDLGIYMHNPTFTSIDDKLAVSFYIDK